MNWKVFDKNLQCRDFQFEVGKDYHQDGKIILCKNGFHYHTCANDLFNYYAFHIDNRVCEIEASGVIIHGEDKSVSSDIKLIKELDWHEVLDLVNTGKGNSGYGNSGNRNSGDGNSGNRNSGYGNSGHGNYGNGNSGHGNSGDGNSGWFNTDSPKMRIFNQDLEITMNEFVKQYCIPILPILTEYIDEKLITHEYKKGWEIAWNRARQADKEYMQQLPNFDPKIFEEITGIKV